MKGGKMTLYEAINNQEDVAKQCHSFGYYKREEATKLGVEAMKRLLRYRKDYYYLAKHLLPGEAAAKAT